MRISYIVIIALVITGIIAGKYLLPSANELAMMRIDGAGMIESRASYETQLTVGNLSPEIVFPLVRIYLENNELNRAIALLEAYLQKNPDDIRALDRIGTLYQYAGRQEDYARTLERMNALRADPESLKKLSDIYNYNKDYDRQVEVLEKVIAAEPDKTENYTKLAFIYRQMGRNDDAANTMRRLFERNPDAMNQEAMESWVIALSQVGRQDDAFAIANNWLSTQSGAARQEAALRIANIFYAGRRADLSLILLQPYKEVKNVPELSIALVRAELATGQENAAFERMSALYKESALPDGLRELFLDVAIRRKNFALIEQLTTPEEVVRLPEFRLIQLIEFYQEERRPDDLKRLRAGLGEKRLSQLPVVDALFALALREDQSVPKATALLSQPRNVYQTLALGKGTWNAGLGDLSREYLYSLRPYTQVEDPNLGALTWLMLQHQAIDEGLQTFEGFRNSRPSYLVDLAWVKMATAKGQARPVIQWMNARADDLISPAVLRDIYYIATDYNHSLIAVHASRRLYWRTAQDADQFIYASALLKNTQQEEALVHIAELKANGYPIDANLESSLIYLAAEKDPAYRPQLIAMLQQELQNPETTDERKFSILQRLLSYQAANDYEPYIVAKAKEDVKGPWFFLYQDLLRQQGRKKELNALIASVTPPSSNVPATPLTDRQRAFNLLNEGKKEEATALFFNLSREAKPGDKNLEQLLYLWGARPTEEQLGWLASRAEQARGAERVEWLKILQRSGGLEQINALMAATPASARSNAEEELYFDVLLAQGRLSQSAPELQRMIDATQDIKRLETLRGIAQASGFAAQSEAALVKMMALRPGDNNLLKEKAISLYNSNQYAEAISAFQRYHAASGTDFRTFYYTGESMNRLQRADEALPYYQRALAGAKSVRGNDVEANLIAAQSLYRLGRTEEARDMMARVVAANPNNKNLNADYVLMLMASKQYSEARRFLEATEDASVDVDMQPALRQRTEMNSNLTAPPQQPQSIIRREMQVQPMAGKLEGIALPRTAVTNVRKTQMPGELVIEFSGPAAQQPVLRQLRASAPAWLNVAAVSYDSVVLTADPGITIQSDFRETAGTSRFMITGVLPEKAKTVAARGMKITGADREGQFRLEMLRAQLELETGNQSAARKRLEALNEQHPNNPQILAALASVEWYMGHNTSARRHINQSLVLAPNNQDAIRLRDSMHESQRGFVKVDGEVQLLDDDTQIVGQVHGETRIDGRNAVGIIADNNYVMAEDVRRGERGNIEDKNAFLTRQEIYWRNDLDNGDQVKVSGYYNQDTLGAGAEYMLRYFQGDIGLVGEYHRPNWDFVEGVLDRATRDRVAYWQTVRLKTDIAPWFLVAYNNYNTEFANDVAQSVTVTGQVRLPLYYIGQTIDRRLFAEYGLDAEYRTETDRGTTAFGQSYLLYPLVTREVHYATLGWRQNLSTRFIDPSYWEVFGGWAYDRIGGGNGPYLGGRWVQQIDMDKEFQLRFSHSIGFRDTDADSTRLGGYLKWKFDQ